QRLASRRERVPRILVDRVAAPARSGGGGPDASGSERPRTLGDELLFIARDEEDGFRAPLADLDLGALDCLFVGRNARQFPGFVRASKMHAHDGMPREVTGAEIIDRLLDLCTDPNVPGEERMGPRPFVSDRLEGQYVVVRDRD